MSNIKRYEPGKQISLEDLDKTLPTNTKQDMGPEPLRRGRLIFAMDATASRQPTWDMAMNIQVEMFEATQQLGGIDISLCYYRGVNECKASPFMSQSDRLKSSMQTIVCHAGTTQIERVLNHALKSAEAGKIHALVFVGDAMEENEAVLYEIAYKLQGKCPVFMFQEKTNQGFTTSFSLYHQAQGPDPVEATFRRIADITGGAYAEFGAGSAKKLRELLGGVAVLISAGRQALEDYAKKNPAAQVLLLGKAAVLLAAIMLSGCGTPEQRHARGLLAAQAVYSAPMAPVPTGRSWQVIPGASSRSYSVTQQNGSTSTVWVR